MAYPMGTTDTPLAISSGQVDPDRAASAKPALPLSGADRPEDGPDRQRR